MTMLVALAKFLHDNESAFEGNDDFIAEVAAFIEAYNFNKNAAVLAHVDNSGFSTDKLAQKLVLSDKASNLCGKAYVKLKKL